MCNKINFVTKKLNKNKQVLAEQYLSSITRLQEILDKEEQKLILLLRERKDMVDEVFGCYV